MRLGARRWIGLALAVLVAAAFAYLNAAERVAIDIGVSVLYQISLVGLVFGVYLLGMATMYLLGLRHDLRVRRLLREHGLEDALGEALGGAGDDGGRQVRDGMRDDPEPVPPLPPDRYP